MATIASEIAELSGIRIAASKRTHVALQANANGREIVAKRERERHPDHPSGGASQRLSRPGRNRRLWPMKKKSAFVSNRLRSTTGVPVVHAALKASESFAPSPR